jgi:hypothetical protein
MDNDTLSLLKTVCVAGRARSAFDGNSNERLEKLVEEGLLVVVNATAAGLPQRVPKRYYRPTEQGREMYRKLTETSVA